MDHLFLVGTSLFQGIGAREMEAALACLGGREARFGKDDILLRAGGETREFGLVVSGSVNVVVSFYWGQRHIFGHIGRGDIFAFNYAALPGQDPDCDVVAAEDTEALFLDARKLLDPAAGGCPFHRRLVHNLLRISVMKNLNLSARMRHIAPKGIRDRLLSYLSEQAQENGGPRFAVPFFSHQQLADYLGVERSALSRELSRMQKEGLISYRRNEFTLNGGAG